MEYIKNKNLGMKGGMKLGIIVARMLHFKSRAKCECSCRNFIFQKAPGFKYEIM